MPRDHYSYAAYADPSMAARFDARRFGGPIGRMLLEDQERILVRFLGQIQGRHILDIGTGTGRAALALARRGAQVTGIDASSAMLAVARQRAADAGMMVDFAEGDVHALAFGDRHFDAVVCLRVLMHVPDWRKALREICRVSRETVVLDYPARWSAAALQSRWRRCALWLGRTVEAYRVFSGAEIAEELRRHGFSVSATHKQFVLPIAMHKALGSPTVTRGVEGVLARAGVLQAAGSPVTITAERCAS